MSGTSEPILVVDDEEVVQMSLRELLESEGYPVVTASSGEQALEVVENRTVAMVITDVMMPGMTGLQLQRRLLEHSPTLPVLVITGFPTIERAVSAIQGGAVNFITKPFDIDSVLETVSRTLRARGEVQRNVQTLTFGVTNHRFDVPGTLDHVAGLLHYFSTRTLLADAFIPSVQFQIRLALDEILTNAIKHGCKHDASKHVHVQACITGEVFEATIEDEGDGFDVDHVQDPTDELALMELAEGGRGIFLVRCYMDDVEYHNHGRRVFIRKHNREA